MNQDEREAALKPCPFCGESDLRTVMHDFGVDDVPAHYSISCNECLLDLTPMITREKAIAAWNRRALSKPAEVDVESLKLTETVYKGPYQEHYKQGWNDALDAVTSRLSPTRTGGGLMAENSGIEWTHHTFNPWIGCTKVSPACDNCYAAEWDKRYEGGIHWGPKAPRRRTSAANWNKPLKWDKEAAAKGIRYRVFCASLADVFDNQVDPNWRDDLWRLIRATSNLDWLLLTKRAPNIKKMLPADWGSGYPNVWLGTTVENQDEWNKRGRHITEVEAVVRFLSCEPLLGRIDYGPSIERIDWIITGGESGAEYRHADAEWFRAIRDQCIAANKAFLFKQWEGKNQHEIKKLGRLLDNVLWDQYPTPRKT